MSAVQYSRFYNPQVWTEPLRFQNDKVQLWHWQVKVQTQKSINEQTWDNVTFGWVAMLANKPFCFLRIFMCIVCFDVMNIEKDLSGRDPDVWEIRRYRFCLGEIKQELRGVGGVSLGQGRVRKRTGTCLQNCCCLGQKWNRLERSGCRGPVTGNKGGKCDNRCRKWWCRFIVAVSVRVQVGVLRPKMNSNGSNQCYVSTFRIQLKPPSALPVRNGPETEDIWTSKKRAEAGKWWMRGCG